MLNRVLLIDDDAASLRLLEGLLRISAPAAELEFRSLEAGMPGTDVDWSRYELLFLTHRPRAKRVKVVDWFRQASHDYALPPTVILAEQGNEELAVKAMKLGAIDYLNLSRLSTARLAETVADALACLRLRRFEYRDTTVLTPVSSPEPASEATTIADLMAWAREPRQDASAEPKLGGFSIPGYVISRLLGSGGMASVLLANRVDDGLPVALKVIPLDQAAFQTQTLRGFMREYSVLAELLHPHVVHIHERAFANDFAYIAMEYLPGGDLKAKLDDGLDLETVKSYVAQIAGGLGAAHALDIVHRDLKPANILFRQDGSLALIDFGVAREIEHAHGARSPEPVAGTPHYLSPEQIQGHAVDARSDLYSLGVVLFEMLTGQPPFAGRELTEILRAHLMAPAPALTGANSSLQPLLDGLLAKDPDDRFQSAEEVLDALEWV